MICSNGQLAVFSRWEDEDKWDLIASVQDLAAAISAIEADMKSHIERTELPGCPNRISTIALVVGSSSASPIPDGKREVTTQVIKD